MNPISALNMLWDYGEGFLCSQYFPFIFSFKTLSSELEHTSADLQSLRPLEDETGDSAGARSTPNAYVKNGINPNAAVTQVHYIKGYFLLR